MGGADLGLSLGGNLGGERAQLEQRERERERELSESGRKKIDPVFKPDRRGGAAPSAEIRRPSPSLSPMQRKNSSHLDLEYRFFPF